MGHNVAKATAKPSHHTFSVKLVISPWVSSLVAIPVFLHTKHGMVMLVKSNIYTGAINK